MTFAAVMEEALYGDGGYYRRPEPPMGPGGDYVTGPSLSPLFGRALARLLSRLDGALGVRAALLDAGCGDGSLLAGVAAAPGGDERELLGWDRVERPLVSPARRITEPEELGPRGVEGLIVAYELFDALPVHRLVGRADGPPGELWVAIDDDGRFAWRPGDLSRPELEHLLGGSRLEPGQVADLSPGWRPLAARLASSLRRGLLVVFDYGFSRQGLLDSRVRRHGTLACYRRHRVHRDPFRDLGAEDLTAHVDFTTVREAGEEAGLETLAWTRQTRWLLACGLFDDLAGASASQRAEARALLDPAGMGDALRVLVQARGLDGLEALAAELLSPPGSAGSLP